MNVLRPGGRTYRRSRRRISHLLVLTISILVVSSTATGADEPRPQGQLERAVLGVGVARCTFIDHTRSVLDYATTPATVRSTSRTLLTEIRYPTQSTIGSSREIVGAAPARRNGGYPVIVFAHGYNVTPDTYAPLLDAWTRAGFVVVAPFFPDEKASTITAEYGADTEADLANEPADLTFVTQETLHASAATSPGCPVLHGLVNPTQIALTGQSDGADAVAMLFFDKGEDPQGVRFTRLHRGIDYRALIVMSGAEIAHQSYSVLASRPSLLMIQSLADPCNPVRSAEKLYRAVRQSNKWFLALRSAHHLPPFDGVDQPAFTVVSATSIAFLRMSFDIAPEPVNLAAVGDQLPDVARILVGGGGPSLRNVAVLPQVCAMT